MDTRTTELNAAHHVSQAATASLLKIQGQEETITRTLRETVDTSLIETQNHLAKINIPTVRLSANSPGGNTSTTPGWKTSRSGNPGNAATGSAGAGSAANGSAGAGGAGAGGSPGEGCAGGGVAVSPA